VGTIARGRFIEFVVRDGWEYIRRVRASGVVSIVGTTDENALVLVEQFRIPLGCRTIELPSGLVGDVQSSPDEALEQAAIRELEEETGFRARHWMPLTSGPSQSGASSEVVTFFRATGLLRVGTGGGDPTENITVLVTPLDGIDAVLNEKAAAGVLVDPKVYAALYFIHSEKHAPRQ